jgi:DNA-binding MarR family transcriptional regulator
MTTEKKPKVKIKRRPAGLVITPPKPRPVEADHPARLLLKDAIERAKSNTEPSGTDLNLSLGPTNNLSEDFIDLNGDTSKEQQPLQIFKDLKDVVQEPDQRKESTGSEISIEVVRVDALKEIATLPFPEQTKDELHPNSLQNHSSSTFNQLQLEELSLDSSITFGDFESSFRKRLSKGQLRICRVLFEKTYALGISTCMIKVSDLMEQAQVKRRNLFLSLNELEKAGFIERGAVYNTPTRKGIEIRFWPVPQVKKAAPLRSFHYIDNEF